MLLEFSALSHARLGALGDDGGCGGVGGVCANPAIGRKMMAAMVTMGFIFMILARESLARNRDEDDFLARVRDPKRCAGSRITPLPRLVRLISKAPQRLLRAVGKMQSLIARAVNDLRRAGRYKFVGRSRACR